MSRLARLALRCYPPSFRARYEEELEALVEDVPESARTTLDLFRGAARAWIRPRFTGPDAARRRLQASVSTTWIAWCAGFLVVPATNKALLDPPGDGATSAVRILLYCGSALLIAGWLLALVGVFLLIIRAVVPALRSRTWGTVRPLIPAIVLGVIVSAGLLALTLINQSNGGGRAQPTTGFLIVGGVWLVGLVGFLCCLGLGPAVSLERLKIGKSLLRVPAMLAVALAVLLIAMSGCDLIAVIVSGDAALLSSVVPVILVLAVACAASIVALISSTRGIGAALHP